MIKTFKHKGLERFYRSGSTAGIQAKHQNRLRLILSNLNQAESPDDMDLPGLKLHELKGEKKVFGLLLSMAIGVSHSDLMAVM